MYVYVWLVCNVYVRECANVSIVRVGVSVRVECVCVLYV